MGLGPPPTLIEHCHMRFVIAGMPDRSSLRTYIQVKNKRKKKKEQTIIIKWLQELARYNTKMLVRVSNEGCSDDEFKELGLDVENLVFMDGGFPEIHLIDEWLNIVRKHFQQHPQAALAVHCKSGLGRSAILVAIALMESGMKNQEAIDFIRE